MGFWKRFYGSDLFVYVAALSVAIGLLLIGAWHFKSKEDAEQAEHARRRETYEREQEDEARERARREAELREIEERRREDTWYCWSDLLSGLGLCTETELACEKERLRFESLAGGRVAPCQQQVGGTVCHLRDFHGQKEEVCYPTFKACLLDHSSTQNENKGVIPLTECRRRTSD